LNGIRGVIPGDGSWIRCFDRMPVTYILPEAEPREPILIYVVKTAHFAGTAKHAVPVLKSRTLGKPDLVLLCGTPKSMVSLLSPDLESGLAS